MSLHVSESTFLLRSLEKKIKFAIRSANSFRAECESRALRYVEELLERGVTEEHLLKAVSWLEISAANVNKKCLNHG